MGDQKKEFLFGYESHVDELFRYSLSKVSDRELAKDIVQEVFVKTWEYIASGHEVTNMKAFLYRSLNNLIVDTYRKKKSSSLDALREDGFDPTDDAQRPPDEKIDGRRALELLSKLSRPYSDVIIMRYVNGLEISEIAEITGES